MLQNKVYLNWIFYFLSSILHCSNFNFVLKTTTYQMQNSLDTIISSSCFCLYVWWHCAYVSLNNITWSIILQCQFLETKEVTPPTWQLLHACTPVSHSKSSNDFWHNMYIYYLRWKLMIDYDIPCPMSWYKSFKISCMRSTSSVVASPCSVVLKFFNCNIISNIIDHFCKIIYRYSLSYRSTIK